MVVDPGDSGAVGAAVAAWATQRFDGPVTVVGQPSRIGGGFDSYIHVVELAGDALPAPWREPLVVRLQPSVERMGQAQHESAVQDWCADRHYPAPRVHAVLAPSDGIGLPAQVMERAPGDVMLSAALRPWRIPAILDRLAALAARLHALPVDDFPPDPDGRGLVDRRLALPRRAVAELDVPALARALDRAEAQTDAAMGGPHVVCHGDFHPLNVLLDGDRATVIDWTDGGLGPREADVSRTIAIFHVAELAAKGRVTAGALRWIGPRLARRYETAYRSRASLDATQLNRWEAFHGLHGWAQVEMLHAGAFGAETSASPDDVPARLAPFLQGRVEGILDTLR